MKRLKNNVSLFSKCGLSFTCALILSRKTVLEPCSENGNHFGKICHWTGRWGGSKKRKLISSCVTYVPGTLRAFPSFPHTTHWDPSGLCDSKCRHATPSSKLNKIPVLVYPVNQVRRRDNAFDATVCHSLYDLG